MGINNFITFPLKSKSKEPAIVEWQKLQQSVKIPSGYNMGILAGNVSNITVIDLDSLMYEDIFCLREFPTLQSQHCDTKKHIFYEYNPRFKNLPSNFTGIEILNDGRYACGAPSIHPDGSVYQWVPNQYQPIIQMPPKVEMALKQVIDTRLALIGSIGQCRHCMRNLLTLDEDEDRPNVRGEIGRKLMMMFCTDLISKGATANEIDMLARLLYDKDYDAARTAKELHYLKSERTFKCSTVKSLNPGWCENCKKSEPEPIEEQIFKFKGLDLNQIVGLDEVKRVITMELELRAHKQKCDQKLILCEGPPGTGKSSIINAFINYYLEKYPNEFHYTTLRYSYDIKNINEQVHKVFEKLRLIAQNKSLILLIDEGEEELPNRRKGGFIHSNKAHAMLTEFGEEIPNMLCIAISNRPGAIDGAIRERFKRINCPKPTTAQIKQLLEIHINFVSEDFRARMLDFIEYSVFDWSGRDIHLIAQSLKTVEQFKRLTEPSYVLTYEDLRTELDDMDNSKACLQNDYLNDNSKDKKRGKK